MTAGQQVQQQARRPLEPRAEWLRAAPAAWERRLREISPVTDRVSHLRFRWRADTEEWWLYEALPKAQVAPDRAAQFDVHWSDLPTEQQAGRRHFVTDYQFWMWHTQGFEVRPFWVLQGSPLVPGGTPYQYTERERRLLEAEGLDGEPVPPGTLPAIPFDERVVAAVLARDALLKAGRDLDRLERSRSAASLKAEDEETEREFRRRFLSWHARENGSCVEFMQWYRHTEEYKRTLGEIPAPAGLADTLATYRETFIETGALGGGVPASRPVQIPVYSSLVATA